MEGININKLFNNTYYGKTVLVTGHTGFKGSWLSIWLSEMGAEVIGYGLDPYTEKDNFVVTGLDKRIVDIRGDIRDEERLYEVFQKYKPEIVFHLAAQPLVRLSYEKPKETYEINIIGTLNVLECIRKTESVRVGVMITTDKCYENNEQIWGYRESDPMGGNDPYSSSKGCCELLISSYRNSYFNIKNYDKHGKAISSARAGNVIGGGDWAKDRIVPDCIKALRNNENISIRNPYSIRPWQHVLEPLNGYLMLATKMYEEPIKYSGGWNFGPNPDSAVSVIEIVKHIIKNYNKGKFIYEYKDKEEYHEANLLLLDITKAKRILEWQPIYDIEDTIKATVEWYKKFENEDCYKLCVVQINEFIQNMDKLKYK